MSKKRKTKQQKIILQLKRQLNQQFKQPTTVASLDTSFQARQEVILKEPQIQSQDKKVLKNNDISNLSGDLKLIKKDLLKTFILTLLIISFEFVLYLKLR
jgi:hypothetical protein